MRRVLPKAVILLVLRPGPPLGERTIHRILGLQPETDPPTADEMLQKVDSLVQQNEQLEKQNHELINLISALRRALSEQAHTPQAAWDGARTAEA